MSKRTQTFNEYEAILKCDNPAFDTDKQVMKPVENKLDDIDGYYIRKHKKRLNDRDIRNLGDAGMRELLAKLGMWLNDNPGAVNKC